MSDYTVGVVGAGNMGRGIIRRLTAAGHDVVVSDHSLDKAAEAAQVGGSDQPGSAVAVEQEVALGSDIVILALWYPLTVEVATANREVLAGKIVIDLAIPLDASFTGLTVEPTTSAAEELAKAVPESAVVKAFNTITAQTLLEGVVDSTPLDVFVASDDETAKATVLNLLEGSGLRPLDAGVLANARLLERLTAFGIELGQRYDIGFDFGFKYLPTRTLSVKSAG